MSAALVFDLGGVLCRFRPELRLAALSEETGMPTSEIHAAIWESGLDRRAEAGCLSEQEATAAVLDALGCRLDPQALYRCWSEAFEPDRRLLDLLATTSSRRYVFTNNGPLLGGRLKTQLQDVSQVVDRIICSCQLRARKPDSAALRRLAVTLDLDPTEITFIDDALSNCYAAQAIGIRARYFTGLEPLSLSLRSLGFL